MEGAAENFNLSLCINGPIRDLLHKSQTQPNLTNGYEPEGGEDGEDLQLSLGLSMNGRFGIDPASKKLKRSSSSILNLNFTIGNGVESSSNSQRARGVASEIHAPLRTCSMPINAGEEEEELRQRKEVQSMRRMEARKKRMEKLKNVRVVKDNFSDDVSNNGNGLNNSSRRNVKNGNVLLFPSSQGSIGSHRSSSSGFSDLQSQQAEGASHQNAEVKSPSSVQQLQTEHEPLATVRAAAAGADRTATKRDSSSSNELLKNALMDMPYVTTKVGFGINRVEGFLYRYKKGEEVKIVCVCHGLFLSPAEFVKHGGGADVENPLKHIVVSNSPLF